MGGVKDQHLSQLPLRRPADGENIYAGRQCGRREEMDPVVRRVLTRLSAVNQQGRGCCINKILMKRSVAEAFLCVFSK